MLPLGHLLKRPRRRADQPELDGVDLGAVPHPPRESGTGPASDTTSSARHPQAANRRAGVQPATTACASSPAVANCHSSVQPAVSLFRRIPTAFNRVSPNVNQ